MPYRVWRGTSPPFDKFILNKDSPQAQGLVGWWPATGSWGANVLRDMSGHNLHGAAGNAPLWNANATRGMAWSGDGNDIWTVTYDAILNITGPITVTAWANFSSSRTNGTIYGMMQHGASHSTASELKWVILRNGFDNKFTFRVSDGSSTYTLGFPTYSLDTWQFYAAVYDGANIYAYLNSTATNTAAGASLTSRTDNLVLNGSPTLDDFYGSMDDIRIYNYALSADLLEQIRSSKPYDLYWVPTFHMVMSAPAAPAGSTLLLQTMNQMSFTGVSHA